MGIHSAGVRPGIDRREARGLVVDWHDDLSKGAPAALLERCPVVGRFEREGLRLGHVGIVDARVPGFVVTLALGDHVHVDALGVARQGQLLVQPLRAVLQGGLAATRVVAEGEHGIRARGGRGAFGGWIEDETGTAMDDARVFVAEPVVEDALADLRGTEERGIVGDVAFDMPLRADPGVRLLRGPEVEVRPAQPDGGRAVVLASRRHGEVHFQYNLGPGGAALLRWLVSELQRFGRHGLRIADLPEGLVLEQRYSAGRALGTRDRWDRALRVPHGCRLSVGSTGRADKPEG